MSAPKRKKVEKPTNPTKRASSDDVEAGGYLRCQDIDGTAVEALRQRNETATPFPHIVLEPLCESSRLRRVLEEVSSDLSFTFKESDLFKVYQSSDLANIKPSQAKSIPELFKLRTLLYSNNFRSFISNIMGVSPLTDKIDCSVNIYSQSCQLLCHDDVVGTRSVAYIIYLTDPDEPWDPKDGGSLELYDLDDSMGIVSDGQPPARQGVPLANPCNFILPKFNSMALFRTQPGRSYHSVQEVYTGAKPRLSISGWYHGAAPPTGADSAHLKQVASLGPNKLYRPIKVLPSSKKHLKPSKSAPLCVDDISYLATFVNRSYLSANILDQLREVFADQGSLLLHSFLNSDINEKIQNLLWSIEEQYRSSVDYTNYKTGIGGGWSVVGPSLKRRHLVYNSTSGRRSLTDLLGDIDGCAGLDSQSKEMLFGDIMDSIKEEIFLSAPFLRLMKLISDQAVIAEYSEVRRFRPGLDYTIAHMGLLSHESHLDVSLTFVDCSGDSKKGKSKKSKVDEVSSRASADYWSSGEPGGFLSYVKSDGAIDSENIIDVEASEVFKSIADTEEDDENLQNVHPAFGALSVKLRNPREMSFTKYINSFAVGSRWDILTEFQLAK
jgi:Rps23 Pro-64 3,4-dihydroxylase Tpa1-like proline 4-hydroxylase